MKNVSEFIARMAEAGTGGAAAPVADAGAAAAAATATAGIGALNTKPVGDAVLPAAGAGGDTWYKDLNPEFHTAITAKGWDKLAAGDVTKTLADSYFNLEKLVGADKAGNAVVPPKADAPQEVKDAFYAKLGRPEKPDGYEIILPEGVDRTLATAASQQFHKMGLTKEQGEATAAWYQAQEIAAAKTWADKSTIDVSEWTKEQGEKLDVNMEAARRAVRNLGFKENDPKLNAFERAFGTKGMMDLFAKIGGSVMEAGSPGTTSSTASAGGLTADSAKSTITKLSTDAAFQARLLSPNAKMRGQAQAEWEDLHKKAYPQ